MLFAFDPGRHAVVLVAADAAKLGIEDGRTRVACESAVTSRARHDEFSRRHLHFRV
jgi:hypothetical protein